MRTNRKVGGDVVAHEYRHPLLGKISGFLECLSGLPDPTSKRSVRWTPLAAGTAAVLMALDPGCSLSVRCEDSLLCMERDFTGRRRVGRTYNGLLKALERQRDAVLPVLKASLRTRAAAAIERIPRVAGWLLMAVDGSKEDLPRTRSHEQTFGIADNGKYPQAFVTAVVEVQTGLVWDWRIDRGDASERSHLVEMAAALPERSVLLADANFVGYRLWSTLHGENRRFLLRVGANVHLLRGLWPETAMERRNDIVYAWPRGRQCKDGPMRLRLIRVGPKRNPVWLVTNVLDPTLLSRRSAGTIYRLRWGVELFYRTFKRTLCYAKLRSRCGRRARIELEWGMITVAIVIMLGIHAPRRRRIDPRRISPAWLIRVLRRALLHEMAFRTAANLDRELAAGPRDDYQRRGPKHSRHRPVTKNTPRPLRLKPPNIRRATAAERRLARERYPHLAA